MKIFTGILKAAVLTGALVLTAGLTSCDDERAPRNVNGWTEWAGVRCSPYGWRNPQTSKREYPSESTLKSYVNTMQSFYNKDEETGARGAVVLIVGTVSGDDDYSCSLGFPNRYPRNPSLTQDEDTLYNKRIESFSKGKTGAAFNDEDRYDSYLAELDKASNIDVWLQVESGYTDIVKLAKVVMNRYQYHSCVKGFGIDVEWYQNTEDGEPGVPLTDSVAKSVDEAVKAINPEYSVFVKHWETGYLPPKYRGKNKDMVFVTDSQGFTSLTEATTHYDRWANHYDPNPVFFQIAYNADSSLWKSFENPLKGYGTYILQNLAESDQKRGIIWVDFTFIDAYNLSK